jgi:hypothetical protein
MSKRKTLGVGGIRDMQRDEVQKYNDNGVYLPNPSAEPLFDKHKPIPSSNKALAFGMEPTAPKRLYELPRGDAGAGQTVYRRIQAFYELAGPGGPLGPARVSATPYSDALPIITMRSTDQRCRYWHVSIFGTGTRRPAQGGAPIAPLAAGTIQNRQLIAYQVEFPAGTFVDISPRYLPSVPTAQARVMVSDESGQRFFDVDVLGSRSFNVYAWGVTVFLLVKPGGYEVDPQNPGANATFTGNSLGVEDDLIGGRVVGIFTNRTESIQNRTLTINIDPAQFGGATRIIPVPPGAKTVQIFSHDPGPVVSWLAQFWYGGASGVGARPDVGIIDWDPTAPERTAIVQIPNAPSIALTPANPAVPPRSFSIVFEVEP